MSKLQNEATKNQQAQAYAQQKRYERSVEDDYLVGRVSESLMCEVMQQSDHMHRCLLAEGHVSADLVRVAGL